MMIIKTETVSVKTQKDHQYIEITNDIQEVINRNNLMEGITVLTAPHTTAALVTQEPDETIHQDTKTFLLKQLPLNVKYNHDYEGNLNATAHIKNQLLGSNVIIPVKDGKLVLGTWQRVFFVELLEGGRLRNIIVSLIGK